MVRCLAIFLVCMVLSCGRRNEVKGPAFVLRAASTTARSGVSLIQAAEHDAGIISRRLQYLGHTKCAVRAQDSTIVVQSPTAMDSGQVAAVARARGVLSLYEVRDDSTDAAALNSVAAYYDRPQSQQSLADLTRIVQDSGGGGQFWVRPDDYDRFTELLQGATGALPESVGLAFGPVETYRGKTMRRLFVIGTEPAMLAPGVQRVDTAHIDTAQTRTRDFSAQLVNFSLSDTNVEKFSQLTARMVGRRLAIVVDSVVLSAPAIQDRITDGRLSIVMYDASFAPARLLAATISSGPLDVSWRVTGK